MEEDEGYKVRLMIWDGWGMIMGQRGGGLLERRA